jgi:multiple sugar transport system ATP-binding protein
MVHMDIGARAAITEDVRELAEDVGDDRIARGEGAPHATVVGRFGARSTAGEGDVIEVAVDARSMHFFDPETGLGIYE